MDVHTYNPSTTALENIFRRGSAAAGFPLLSPSWASCLAREDNSKTDDDDSNMAFVSSVRKLSIQDQQESSDEEDESQQPEADDREPCMWSAPPVRRIPGPAPWTAGHNLLREWEEGATNTTLAPRARAQQADTHSSPLDSYLHFLTRHTSRASSHLRTMAAAADDTNPMSGLGAAPAVSFRTIAVTGILADVFGLDDLPPATTHLSVLWLHNPRLGDRTRMHALAQRTVHEYNQARRSSRGLIAVAFDQRNHGVREVHPLANQSWKKGNPHHAQDMFGIVSGTVVDTRLLMDALPGYLFLDEQDDRPRPEWDQHICLGVSLGGHSTWQALFTDPRVTAGVSIIGCPDFQLLMKDRAALSKLATYDKSTNGASFLGSRDFPPALVAQCAQFDPKGIVFGTGPVVEAPATAAAQAPLRQVLDRTVRGKRVLLCSGQMDKLVPWRCSESFTRFLVHAADTWYKDAGLRVDNREYKYVAHECSDEMVVDAVRFICEVVHDGPAGAKGEGKGEWKVVPKMPKI